MKKMKWLFQIMIYMYHSTCLCRLDFLNKPSKISTFDVKYSAAQPNNIYSVNTSIDTFIACYYECHTCMWLC